MICTKTNYNLILDRLTSYINVNIRKQHKKSDLNSKLHSYEAEYDAHNKHASLIHLILFDYIRY